ncbi:ribosomal protection-like ABC-F family protein [Lactobacillus terrae]|uniref:ribosomal protection-like ABC-F family protein n=1 Tax=Lactobacillus terrae TaxID=2269374 RepID=UPI000C1B6138|nr:ATP-binding cassette domain-containing protein [Lactobacillus terrae]
MGTININNLNFRYNQMSDYLFQNVNLNIDETWKLGLVGRNGRGKTTLLKILSGDLPSDNSVNTDMKFYMYPQNIEDPSRLVSDIVTNLSGINIYDMWKIEIEFEKLHLSDDVLERQFDTLSPGEQTKVLLAILFADERGFQLIDEPTNHLDIQGRQIVSEYLKNKKGFIVVSHDKYFLNEVIDHVISINKADIDTIKGNYDTWETKKNLQDSLEIEQKKHLTSEIKNLNKIATKRKEWAGKSEKQKNKTKGQKDNLDKGFIGHKSAKMMKKSKLLEDRSNKSLEESRELLKNIDVESPLSMNFKKFTQDKSLIHVQNLILKTNKISTPETSFYLNNDDIISLVGRNGIGKTTIFRQIMGISQPFEVYGEIKIKPQLKISYLEQLQEFTENIEKLAEIKNVDVQLIYSNLRKMGFERESFPMPISQMSLGQQQKVKLAVSFSEESNVYLWDEPLNYVDIITREQIIKMIKNQKPTMIVIDHDLDFINEISNKKIVLG